MQRPRLLLLKKELRQNMLLYLLPAPFVLGLFYLRFPGSAPPPWTGPVFGLAAPFTLAVAYGLQAFDVEEDARTRDFLLAKPLSLGRIVQEKFFIGLAILLGWSLLFLWGASPSVLIRPSIFSVGSWVAEFVILETITVYSVSFLTGLWVAGPKKLLAAAVASIIGSTWGFLTLSSFATFILHSALFALYSPIQEILFQLSAFLVLSLLICLALNVAVWLLQQRPRLRENRNLLFLLAAFLSVPALALALNFSSTPPLRAAYFAGLELFGLEQPFWTVDGVWQPGGDWMALTGAGNVLGLGRLGHKPEVIYRGKKSKTQTLKDPAWSPDGRWLAFVDREQVYIMNLKQRRAVRLGRGSSPHWSNSSDAVLFSRENAPPRRINGKLGRFTVHTVDFYKADLRKNLVEPSYRVQSLSPFWTWDSSRDVLIFADPYGHLTLYRKNKVEFIDLPSFSSGKEGVFWNRFYPVPGKPDRFILALFSVKLPFHGTRLREYTARIYRVDAALERATLLRKIHRSNTSNLILNPSTGLCLWGRGSAYIESTLEEVRQ